MQVNAIISATTQGGKKINTTISYLRQSQKARAAELAQALNALTNNIYQSVQVNEINVDITGKQTPTLTVGPLNMSSDGYYVAEYTYTGDGQLFLQCNTPASFITYSGNPAIRVNTGVSSISGTIYATETENYNSVTANFSRS